MNLYNTYLPHIYAYNHLQWQIDRKIAANEFILGLWSHNHEHTSKTAAPKATKNYCQLLITIKCHAKTHNMDIGGLKGHHSVTTLH